MEEELEGTIRIENYFHQSGAGADDEQKETIKQEQPGEVLGSLAVVDSLTAGQESWPQDKGFGRGRPRGPMKAAYEPDSQKRSNKQCARKNGIVKKCSELAVITGGSVFFRFVTLEGKSYVYSSCDAVWEEYIKEGIRSGDAKEIRIDENAKEMAQSKGKGKANGENGTENSSGGDSPQKSQEKSHKTESEIKPESESKNSTEEKTEAAKSKLKSKAGRPKKEAKKKPCPPAPLPPPQEEQQESLTIQTQSTDFLNPSLQTLHIDKKFVISSADVLSDNSLSLHGPDDNESSSVPVVLFPSQPSFQLDPSLVSNGASNFADVIPVPNDPKLNQKKKRKPRKRSESPEPKKEKVDVKCQVCSDQYAKRQDNRRYGRWIGCSNCPAWVHARCVGWTEADVDSARDYFCKECEKKKDAKDAETASAEVWLEGKKEGAEEEAEQPKKKRKIEEVSANENIEIEIDKKNINESNDQTAL